jgi:exodeoxyribonuclease VII large subunit
MALETSAESPAPLRQISMLMSGYIGKLGAVWVEAEVAELKRRPGICFLTLRDLEAKVSMQAKCHVSVLDAVPLPIVAGARVIVHVRPSWYEPTGSLALDIRDIRAQGEGELLAQLERRKQLLRAEGLFDPALKKALPFLPKAIGLVTGKDSAAERDVIDNARMRWPAVTIVSQYALMQGADSARSVIAGVAALEGRGDIDVIVVARGGGSLHDLLPFWDEALVRAVAACTIPVVSAIGHEPDTPLLDLVADLRASTPTDAAKRVVPDVGEEMAAISTMRHRARHAVAQFLEHQAAALANVRSRPVLATPATIVDEQVAVVSQSRDRARRALGHQLEREHEGITHHLARVQALSPLATMRRGYAVAQSPDGHVLTSVHEVPPQFTVRLADGRVHVDTQSTEEKRDG